MAEPSARSGARDFDFLVGSWNIVNERLTSRLTNSDDWERFEATGDCELILSGLGNGDRFHAIWNGAEFDAFSLRLFSLETGKWSIYWADSASGTLLPPVIGEFVHGIGEFYGDDEDDGRPVYVRFRWSEITANSARWEQAFSTDRGKSWETNWVMSFTRR